MGVAFLAEAAWEAARNGVQKRVAAAVEGVPGTQRAPHGERAHPNPYANLTRLARPARPTRDAHAHSARAALAVASA